MAMVQTVSVQLVGESGSIGGGECEMNGGIVSSDMVRHYSVGGGGSSSSSETERRGLGTTE